MITDVGAAAAIRARFSSGAPSIALIADKRTSRTAWEPFIA
jgi:hypothetical protein